MTSPGPPMDSPAQAPDPPAAIEIFAPAKKAAPVRKAAAKRAPTSRFPQSARRPSGLRRRLPPRRRQPHRPRRVPQRQSGRQRPLLQQKRHLSPPRHRQLRPFRSRKRSPDAPPERPPAPDTPNGLNPPTSPAVSSRLRARLRGKVGTVFTHPIQEALVRELRAVRVSDDGKELLLTETGDTPQAGSTETSFILRADDRLRGLLKPRPTNTETRPESALSPREIQARLRAGETAEDVARAAGIPVTRVARYEAPIAAERVRIVDEVRRATAPGSPPRSPRPSAWAPSSTSGWPTKASTRRWPSGSPGAVPMAPGSSPSTSLTITPSGAGTAEPGASARRMAVPTRW